MLLPVASRGLARDWAERALATAALAVSGSMRGVTPRSSGVTGRVGSLQMEGTSTTKGFVFFSAATMPRAAAMASAPPPSSATI
jgi:hypothetical protein